MRLFELMTAARGWAASSTGTEAHSAPITNLIYPLINFLIFAYLLKRFLLPLIKSHLHSRREGIIDAIKTAEEGKKQAEEVLLDYQNRMVHLDEETKTIRETIRAEGEREKARLLTDTEDQVVKIKTDADFLAQQEAKVARQQLREEIARIAQATAEKALRANFKTTDQDRLIDQFLTDIGEPR